MIENIRRYNWLILLVIVVLLLGFLFMDTSGFFTRSGGGGTVVTISGRAYSQSEFRKLGSSPHDLIQRIPDFRLFGFLNALQGDAEDPLNQQIQFFTNRMLIREAREDFGIHPPDSQIDEFVRELRIFQSQPPPGAPPGTAGEFDQASYNTFIQRRLGSYGMVERDFRDLIRDVIATEELRSLIGGGLEASRRLAEAMTVVREQRIEASVASIDMEPFRAKIDPSEDELRTWWETRKAAYRTEPRVKVSYILATPEYPEDSLDPEDSPELVEKSDEDAEAERQRAEARAEIDRQVAIDTDNLITRINDTEGEEFEEAAAEPGWDIHTTDWITRATAPDDLKLPTRSSAAGTNLLDTIFNLTTGPDPLAPFTDAIPVGDAQFVIVRLDDLEPAREKTFEEAAGEVREQYIAETAAEMLETEAEEKTAALESAIAEGKSFEEAATGLDLEPRKLGPWGMFDPLDNEFQAREIFQLASTVNPGEFAEPLISDDRAVIIRVDARTLVKDDNRGQQIDQLSASFRQGAENAAFDAWLRQRVSEARVQTAALR